MFTKHILNALCLHQKIIVVWSSRAKAIEFEKFLKIDFPSFELGKDYLFYESKDNKTIRSATLSNVRESWSSVQLLMYTSAISVGINYDFPEVPFEKLFVYAGAGGPCVRDLFQSTLRCRTIKSNTMEYIINDTCRRFSKMESLKDLEEEERYWKDRNQKFLDRCHQYNEDADIMHGIRLSELDTWHMKIILLNRFERVMCSNKWEAMFNE
jgi:hypothetical protein